MLDLALSQGGRDGLPPGRHSDKEDAAPTWKRTYGHHPLMGFVDHGPGGTGEPVAALLRSGNAGSNTAADHITATRLAQLPKTGRRRILRQARHWPWRDEITAALAWLALFPNQG
ncbi:hypothetical protein Pph01_73960 [Planotetraspora phitsanulokensis]|uniref:Uncharacterized protein n=1 Tax=Planotetraspora phitsanulokensis TaxID=575192 RepID=A0A8J3XN40_9ACTN|nr:hypothetical protein Pph01_73960 [Planotetraspora phitsanulokensis]